MATKPEKLVEQKKNSSTQFNTLLPILALLILVLAAFFLFSFKRDYSTLSPTEVVREYYEAFGRQDYASMYALMSDGFKEIEPTAKDFETFKQYISKYYQTADGVKVLSVRETFNGEGEATVEYSVELNLKTGSRKVSSEFELKKKENGWKLTHPYGLNAEQE
ncbi:nuclear transport factor 2 family protein [Candidatus Micrarchaeota archaeon]|nr:nuclear transport factor 2 family protein [Candidatus Micrarchaeota archaeon]